MKTRLFLSLFALLFVLSINKTYAQPEPPDNHGSTGDEAPAGGGAPITGGLAYLVILGTAYGAKKWFLIRISK